MDDCHAEIQRWSNERSYLFGGRERTDNASTKVRILADSLPAISDGRSRLKFVRVGDVVGLGLRSATLFGNAGMPMKSYFESDSCKGECAGRLRMVDEPLPYGSLSFSDAN